MLSLTRTIGTSCNVRVSRFTVARWVKQLGFSRKKTYSTVRHDPGAERVATFCSQYLGCATNDIVCVDECGIVIGDVPRRGYAPVGKRLNVPVCKNLRRAKMTLIMAIDRHGVLGYEIMDHNCRKSDFVTFLTQLDVAPGSTLVMDNIAFHHSQQVTDVMTRKGVSPLYTPPYSPRFNAIENVFGVLKALYRSECPCNIDPSFDYVSAMHGAVALQSGFDRYFDHALHAVRSVANARFDAYTGYDDA